MARAPKMDGPPTLDPEIVQAAAKEYLKLASELDTKRAATKETTSGKTAWRKRWVEQQIDPVQLADAAEMVRMIKANPEKVTQDWNTLNAYLKALGFFELLVPGLFDAHDAEQLQSAVA